MQPSLIPVLTTLLGAVLGFLFGWAKTIVDDRRKRRGVATALLAEVSNVKGALETLMAGGASMEALWLETPMHERFFEHVGLFEPEAVHAVMHTQLVLRALRSHHNTVLAGQPGAIAEPSLSRVTAVAVYKAFEDEVPLLRGAGAIEDHSVPLTFHDSQRYFADPRPGRLVADT